MGKKITPNPQCFWGDKSPEIGAQSSDLTTSDHPHLVQAIELGQPLEDFLYHRGPCITEATLAKTSIT